ncbi:hypothetical protein [Neptunicoccus sediminis]|uniref:hypothetical protein n=1 Tax=Neptunicoccus sediminis TaxID=1892596 RepID=UPI0008460085|nr:hypothetical protein [Neptunicoccus sediminis]
MLSNLVIHIGDPKNGSSSIQNSLAQGLWQCDSRTIQMSNLRNEVALAKSLRRKGDADNRNARFAELAEWARASEADYGVVSSEFFSQIQPEALAEALDEHLPEYAGKVRILAYVRPHAERFVSTYAQRVKTGLFVRDMPLLLSGLSSDLSLNYHRRFSAWKAVFGEKFSLRPFVRDALNNNDVVYDFFNFVLEGAHFSLKDPGVANRSLGLQQIAAMRAFQKTLIRHKVSRNVRAVMGGAIAHCVGEITSAEGEKLTLDRALLEKVDEFFRDDARKTDSTFFNTPWLESSLDKSMTKAISEPKSTRPRDQLSPEQIQEVEYLAVRCATVIDDNPKIWRAANNVLRGYEAEAERIPLNENEKLAQEKAIVLCRETSRLIA